MSSASFLCLLVSYDCYYLGEPIKFIRGEIKNDDKLKRFRLVWVTDDLSIYRILFQREYRMSVDN